MKIECYILGQGPGEEHRLQIVIRNVFSLIAIQVTLCIRTCIQKAGQAGRPDDRWPGVKPTSPHLYYTFLIRCSHQHQPSVVASRQRTNLGRQDINLQCQLNDTRKQQSDALRALLDKRYQVGAAFLILVASCITDGFPVPIVLSATHKKTQEYSDSSVLG